MARRRPTEPTVNPMRGAALVVIAVLLGLVLLRNGIDTSEVVTSSDDEATSASDGDTADEGADPPPEGEGDTSTTVEARPPADVSVIVLNGTTVPGAAGKFSSAIGTAGYQMLDPGDAPTKIPATQVYFTPGFEAEAEAVALAAGAPETATPVELPSPPPGDVGDANVVMVLGDDLATVTPTTAGSPTTATTAAD